MYGFSQQFFFRGSRAKPSAGVRAAFLAILSLAAISGCKHRTPAGESSSTTISSGIADPERVDERYRAAWDELTQQVERDPASDAVAEAAEALVAKSPPAELMVVALQYRAEQAMLRSDKEAGLAAISRARAAAETSDVAASVRAGMHWTAARTLTQFGESQQALRDLELALEAGERPAIDIAAIRALNYDRLGDVERALESFFVWHALTDESSAERSFCEQRIAGRLTGATREEIALWSQTASSEPLVQCLAVAAGDREAIAKTGTSYRFCRAKAESIGILLPRSGALASLSDRHLAAVAAGQRVLSQQGLASVVRWQDAGSDPQSAQEGALSLLAAGVSTIVGPVGKPAATAVVKAVGGQASLILPGESVGDLAPGVTPSLAQRVRRLLREGKRQGASQVVLFTPDQGYGKLVQSVAQAACKSTGMRLLTVSYPAKTTSFGAFLRQANGKLNSKSVVLVADTMARSEMVVRQLRREVGVTSDASAPLVTATGEGFSRDLVTGPHAVFEGVVFAPAAAEHPLHTDFRAAYRQAEGREPDDQAYAVWQALAVAANLRNAIDWTVPRLLRIEHEELIQESREG